MKNLLYILLFSVAGLMIPAHTVHAQCDNADLMANGSFETGDFTGWITVECAGGAFTPQAVVAPGFTPGFGFSPTAPTDGGFSYVNGFDGGGPCTIELCQDVAVPAGSAATLTWDERIEWDLMTFGATMDRTHTVDILDPVTMAVLANCHTLTGTAGTLVTGQPITPLSCDLSAFAGQTVRVCFIETITEAFTGPGQVEIDNIVLSTVCVEMVPTLGQWGIIVLGLLALLLGMVFMYQRKYKKVFT